MTSHADAFISEALTMMRPLIDELAVAVGESTEAWRGISLVINGLGNLLGRALDHEIGPAATVTMTVAILTAIEEHPAYQAAAEHWENP
jgi:hypothetical protein